MPKVLKVTWQEDTLPRHIHTSGVFTHNEHCISLCFKWAMGRHISPQTCPKCSFQGAIWTQVIPPNGITISSAISLGLNCMSNAKTDTSQTGLYTRHLQQQVSMSVSHEYAIAAYFTTGFKGGGQLGRCPRASTKNSKNYYLRKHKNTF